MDGAGDEVLADSRFAGEQHRGRGIGRGASDQLTDGLHGGRPSHQAKGFQVPRLQPDLSDRSTQTIDQQRHVEWLGQVIEKAAPCQRHRG